MFRIARCIRFWLRAVSVWLLLLGVTLAQSPEPVFYNRDIRPILADNCLHCHGPDDAARKAGLRLDRSAEEVIVAGDPARSELIRRITAEDPAERMPPQDQERQLSEEQIELLRRWVAEGGQYERHWSFVPPERPHLPSVKDRSWPRNPIDYFVLDRLEREGLTPSSEADKATLLRRVTLDLTGLPPTPADADAFLADRSPDAYERAVARLLDSPRYGEQMARVWLDAARFADSGGYQGDILRSMWMWRDWVIDAYNQNMPFDQFTIEQLAGDLLDQPTRDQRIATGFNRNHRINDEDGIILEEFRVEYVVDRVETTATVWLGLTMGCARCHDHKYDPISQEEFYRFFAYFNSIDEKGRGHGNSPPLLHVPTPPQRQQIAQIDAKLDAARNQLAQREASGDAEQQREALAERIAELQKRRDEVRDKAPTTMVMQELSEPRDTFLLIRGAYNRHGQQVSPGTPAALRASSEQRESNRLGLARWLLAPENPLTARVTVNRYWQMYFGRGLVETQEDFGTQGALPSHPELLDWLASEFVRCGWDVKALQRLMVTSATYRQSSRIGEELDERDPQNRLLGRGPRFRLPAETIRDQMLAASGLLVERLGGPSVKPYQPAGLWEELASASRNYEQGQGADLYRRSMYTFIRRTVPPPGMTAFDAPNRETCTVRRARTNTPLQALALMNDPTYTQAARGVAERAVREGGSEVDPRLTWIYKLLLARAPAGQEMKTLRSAFAFYRNRFANRREAAKQLLSAGGREASVGSGSAELAAYTAVAMLVMNLDEAITKE